MDNHTAEWEALLFALSQAQTLNVKNALFFTDSQLIEDAVNREFVKNVRFKPYLTRFLQDSQTFQLTFVKWIPRTQNKAANQLAQNTLFKVLNQS